MRILRLTPSQEPTVADLVRVGSLIQCTRFPPGHTVFVTQVKAEKYLPYRFAVREIDWPQGYSTLMGFHLFYCEIYSESYVRTLEIGNKSRPWIQAGYPMTRPNRYGKWKEIKSIGPVNAVDNRILAMTANPPGTYPPDDFEVFIIGRSPMPIQFSFF